MAERALNSYTCKLTEDQAAQLEACLLYTSDAADE